MQMTLIERWVVAFTGFGQHEGQVTGVEVLQDRLTRQCSGPNVRCLLKSWRDNPKDLAQRIQNHCPEDFDPKIVIIGYSWGGYTAVLLARELQKKNLSVDHLLLCDAVWRSKFMVGYPLSLPDLFSIKVPGNVKNLYSWRQTRNYPRGAYIRRQDEKATVWHADEVYPHVTHENVDDLRSFRDKAREIACPHAPSPPQMIQVEPNT